MCAPWMGGGQKDAGVVVFKKYSPVMYPRFYGVVLSLAVFFNGSNEHKNNSNDNSEYGWDSENNISEEIFFH